MKTSTVERTGGSGLSIYAEIGNDVKPHLPVRVSERGSERLFVELASGVNTVSLYGAYKNWTVDPTARNIWFEIDYFDGSRLKTLSSKSQAALTSDASVWTGDTGLTGFVLTFDTPSFASSRTASVRFFIRGESESGAQTYIDPRPEIT